MTIYFCILEIEHLQISLVMVVLVLFRLSYRNAAKALSFLLLVKISHVFIWNWIQKYKLKRHLKNKKIHEYISKIKDETEKQKISKEYQSILERNTLTKNEQSIDQTYNDLLEHLQFTLTKVFRFERKNYDNGLCYMRANFSIPYIEIYKTRRAGCL